MKKLFLSLGIAGMLGMASCSEDFEVAAPYRDVTVVYGVWDLEDTAHYVRIQKAFLDENKSAIDMSKVGDSSYFRDITVQVREISGATVVGTTKLDRVDLAAEGYMKDSAANDQGFFTTPHYGYKLKRTLNPDLRYRLVITNNENGNVDSSEIAIVSTPLKSVNTLVAQNTQINFSRITGRFDFTLHNKIPNAAFFEMIIRFHYEDINVTTGGINKKYADFFAGRITGTDYRIPNKDIYESLVEKIGPAPSNIERKMTTVDFLLFAGGTELREYERLSTGQGGVTSDQIRPNVTNIYGKNTVGLFASKAHKSYNDYPISPNTVDSLMLNPLTKPLRFIK